MSLAAVAIVCAYNEAPRVQPVLAALREARAARVLLVDDGSTDDTAALAQAAGVAVLRLPANRGKGGAMLAGVLATHEPVVAFFDADLVGLHPSHVRALLSAVAQGEAGMSVGLLDYGAYNPFQTALPLISGQRAVRREILADIPASAWRGFRIEAEINASAEMSGWPVETVVLRGLAQVPKWQKVGVRRGISDGARMLVDVLRATRDAKERRR